MANYMTDRECVERNKAPGVLRIEWMFGKKLLPKEEFGGVNFITIEKAEIDWAGIADG